MRLRTHAGHLATNLSLNMDQHQLRLYTSTLAMTISTQLTATTDTEANRRMSGEDMRHVFMSSLQSDDTEQSRKKVPPTATKLHRRRWRPHSQLKLNISRARPTSTAGVIHGKFYTHLKCP